MRDQVAGDVAELRSSSTLDAGMLAIGITGLSGAGKSSVAAEVARKLPSCSILSTDRYYLDFRKIPRGPLFPRNLHDPRALDWDLLLAHCEALRAGTSVDVPRYDFAGLSREAETDPVEPADVLVVEGIFALADPRLLALLDWRVFLALDDERCLARRIQRDTAERGLEEKDITRTWRLAAKPMFSLHSPRARVEAHLVLDAGKPAKDSARRVAALV